MEFRNAIFQIEKLNDFTNKIIVNYYWVNEETLFSTADSNSLKIHIFPTKIPFSLADSEMKHKKKKNSLYIIFSHT